MGKPDISIPSSYSIAIAGSLDTGLDDIRIKELAPISMSSVSKLDSTSKVDLGLDNIRIKELPKINMGIEFAIKPTRVHLPLHFRFGISALGVELMAFSVCGEGMVVIEDYVPHKTEACR